MESLQCSWKICFKKNFNSYGPYGLNLCRRLCRSKPLSPWRYFKRFIMLKLFVNSEKLEDSRGIGIENKKIIDLNNTMVFKAIEKRLPRKTK
jgi:hypothetical protein